MAITTYLNDNERETYKAVHDKELNELFQEVRNRVSNKYLIQMHLFSERKWMFGKYRPVCYYSLYVDLGYEAQVVNLLGDNAKSSIGGLLHKNTLMTYFFGVITGFEAGKLAYIPCT